MTGPRLVQWSRFSDAFGRLFGIQGATQLNVIDDVFLTLPVEEEDLHLAFLRGWLPWGFETSSAAAVGNFSAVGFNNVPTSGKLVVVQGIQVYQQSSIGLAIGVRAFGGGQAAFPRDLRIGSAFALVPGVSGGNDNAHAVPWVTTRLWSQPAGFVPCKFVVPPNANLVVEAEANNTLVRAAFFGIQREITPQET